MRHPPHRTERGLSRHRAGIVRLAGALFAGCGLAAGLMAAPAGDPPPAWPFVPPADAAPPRVRAADRVRNGIDAFVLSRLEEKQLALAPEAPRRTLVRRLYLDLVGLPPTPAEVDAHLREAAADPRAWEKLVDRLLDDPRYGERWARFWLDLARYADTAGYEGDPDLPHAWRYRDYVIDAFNQDKPWERFVLEQIAGDELEDIMGAGDLPEPKPEQTVALTFLRLAPFTEPRGDATRHELLSEMTATVGSVFLGLTVGCAQCHDHKYDRIPTADFYRMKAFFATVQIPRPLPGDGFQLGGSLPAEFYRPGEKEWAGQLAARRQTELAEARRALAELEKLEKDGNKAEPKTGLTADQTRQRAEGQHRVGMIQRDLARLEPVAMSLRHSYGPPYEPGVPETRVLLRGQWDQPGEVVEPGFLGCVTGNRNPAPIRLDPFKRWPTRSRRLTLARWIAAKDNPLTARVLVNRLWGWHFGRGLVATPSDFGRLSGGASHPELLDWLARRFLDSNGSIKSIHRLVLNSAAWRQSSLGNAAGDAATAVDPDNTLLWRFPRRRLEAEAVRDCVLAVSGRLNPARFGLPIFPPLPEGVAESVKWNDSKWDTQTGPEGRRRSIYIYQQRSLTMPFLQTFDAVVCDASRDRRQHSVTPLQALALYNGAFASEEARHFADRLVREAGPSVDARIALAFRLALGRDPGPDETEHLRRLAESSAPDEGLPAVCRVLFNANEFVHLE